MRTRLVAGIAAALSTLAAPAVATAGTPPPGDSAADVPAVVVGSANFPESELLAQIYGQALAAAGFDVSYQLAIGSREVYFPAIEDGEIDLLPEYTNSLLSFILAPESPSATTVAEQVAELGENLPAGLEVLTPSTAEDKDTIVCNATAVAEHGLTDLSSLAAASADITLGAPPEFETRTPFGLKGFAEILGATFGEFVPLAVGDIPAALASGAIDCANLFSTDPAIAGEGFVALADDQGLVPHEAVIPLIRTEAATPEAVAVLDGVSAALDTQILTGLVAQVVTDQLGADVVAADWLATDPQPLPVPAGTAG